MRLFTALDLPPDLMRRLDRLLALLRPEAAIQWSPLDNLHITTKFIGEWPEARFDELDVVLQNLRLRGPIHIRVQDFGWYPNGDSARVFWAGVDGGEEFKRLAAQTDEALVELGIAKEPHPYSPHLTLARIKGPASINRLKAKVEEWQTTLIGDFRASHYFLYRSDPGPSCSTYSKLRTYLIQS